MIHDIYVFLIRSVCIRGESDFRSIRRPTWVLVAVAAPIRLVYDGRGSGVEEIRYQYCRPRSHEQFFRRSVTKRVVSHLWGHHRRYGSASGSPHPDQSPRSRCSFGKRSSSRRATRRVSHYPQNCTLASYCWIHRNSWSRCQSFRILPTKRRSGFHQATMKAVFHRGDNPV